MEIRVIGMGFLRLNKVLKRVKWTPSRGREEIDVARKKEDRVLAIGVTIFFGLLLAALFFGVR